MCFLIIWFGFNSTFYQLTLLGSILSKTFNKTIPSLRLSYKLSTYTSSIPNEFNHILNDLSSLLPSTSSSINPANSLSYFSSAFNPGHTLKIYPANIKFNLEFPLVISKGLINAGTPIFYAS